MEDDKDTIAHKRALIRVLLDKISNAEVLTGNDALGLAQAFSSLCATDFSMRLEERLGALPSVDKDMVAMRHRQGAAS